jgi:putative N6-adenine-specific DNA methylase
MHRLFAVCPRGLEAPLAAELAALGASDVRPESGGAAFAGDLGTAYRANLHSRIASRILLQVAHGPGDHEDAVHALAAAVAWDDHFAPTATLRVDVSAAHSPLTSLDFTTLRIKDAIVDRMRARHGVRPTIDRARPDVRVYAHCGERDATLYLDLSGPPLFKRGWRADKGEAPLKENLAAGILMLSGWTPGQPLLDPMCGSGTIAIEAACIATRRPPGLNRRFGFERLASFDRLLWRHVLTQARVGMLEAPPCPIEGRDISSQVIEIARRNATTAGLAAALAAGRLSFTVQDARAGAPPAGAENGVIVCNPPYGEQSAPRSSSVPKMMGEIGNRMKQDFAGWQAWWLTADRKLPTQMRLHETRKIVLFNGALECRLFRFDMVRGSYRPGSAAAGPDP